jgi:hypothetical protein
MVYIYALIDPRTGTVGYVGASLDPITRFAAHCAEPGGHTPSRKHRRHQWLFDLRAAGVTPTLAVLDAVSPELAEATERAWIAHFRSIGAAPGNTRPAGASAVIPDEPAGMTIARAAQRLGVSRQRVHELIRTLQISPTTHRAGGHTVRYLSREDMQRLASRRTAPGRPKNTTPVA